MALDLIGLAAKERVSYLSFLYKKKVKEKNDIGMHEYRELDMGSR